MSSDAASMAARTGRRGVLTASWKRSLILAHRWLGIVLCAFFALWFVSGIFMMYVEFPQLIRPERLAGAPALDFSAARLPPGDAVRRLDPSDFDTIGEPLRNRKTMHANDARPAAAGGSGLSASFISSVRLGMLLGRPVYYVHASNGAQPRTVRADTGEVLPRIDASAASAVAADFARRSGRDVGQLEYLGLVQTDQWSVSSALNAHRPLHLIALNDDPGTELYVSSTTGEVVRDSTRLERMLNYPAAVTHWLYPTVIRRHAEAWGLMVKVLSGVGVVLALSGLWIGVIRLRRPRTGISPIPYRGLMRWHHLTGLVFGLVAVTWALSGMLSLNPGGLNPSRSPAPAEHGVYRGSSLTNPGLRPGDFDLLYARIPGELVEAELLHYLGQAFYAGTLRTGTTLLIPASDDATKLPQLEDLIERAPRLKPDAAVERVTVLDAYDDYWYTRHPERGGRALPVVRVQFDDPDRTWFHIDPITGRVLERSTRVNRLYRWLYNGLHSWDIRWLWERRPLWDIAVIGFSLGGLALSLTGLIAGVRYLRRERRRTKERRRRAAFAAV